MKRYQMVLLCALEIMASIAVSGIIAADTARADWLYPDYIESQSIDAVESTSSSDAVSDEDENDSSAQAISKETNGFDPRIDGFKFENYGSIVQYGSDGLTVTEVARMFGNEVCAGKAGGQCILTPPAKRWMDKENDGMKGGHCQGMAILSTLMYFGNVSPTDFGADEPYDLTIEDNKPLQHEIAYWASTPSSSDKDITESPVAVLDNLTRYIKEGTNASELWTLGIYKPEGGGGHAVTPFGVEDMGDGLFRIMVYDNNWPGETRYIEVDRDSNTWDYMGSTDPDSPVSEYSGNASSKSIVLAATLPLMGRQECWFCDEDNDTDLLNESKTSGDLDNLQETGDEKYAAKVKYIQISLDGNASLLITDALGRRIGRLETGRYINEIPEAEIEYPMYAGPKLPKIHIEPTYYIPANLNFSIKVDGTWLTGQGQDEEYVTMIGPGYDLVVEGLLLDPGEQDYIDVATIGKENYQLTYRTNYTDSPDLIIGKDTDLASYEFMARGEKIGPDGEFNVELDMAKGKFLLSPAGNQERDQFELLMHRIDDYGEQFFGAKNITLKSNDTAYLPFLSWEKGQKLYLSIDRGSKGNASEMMEMINNTEFRKYWE